VFDSHCHLHDASVAAPDALAERARAVGVRGFLLAGVAPDSFAAQTALARRHRDMVVAYGVHPQVVTELDDRALDGALDALAAALSAKELVRPVAIGETGLDRNGPDRRASQALQERAFRAQLALARAHDLPVVLHILDAHGPALHVLRRDGVPAAGGVMHSYSGPAELVADYVALGLSISFAGALTYGGARKAPRAARAVPDARLLVETDAPFQTPAERKPAPNEPAFLPLVIEALAKARAQDPNELCRLTEANARRLFLRGS